MSTTATIKRGNAFIATTRGSDERVARKVFVRSNKGRAVKVVSEQYLRKDIPCSSLLCQPCTYNAPVGPDGKVISFVLSEDPPSVPEFGPHYLIPDTNIFLHAIDLIEHPSTFFDVIVLQTVLDEVKNRSIPIYNRLRALVKSQDKRFYVFHNDFRSETHIDRLPGETINDRNDRAIRVAAMWYKNHLGKSLEGSKQKAPRIVMLTNDADNLRKSKQDLIDSCNLRHYVEQLPNSDELQDMISAAAENEEEEEKDEQRRKPSDFRYPEYLSTAKLLGGIKSGTMFQGPLNISQYNFLEGSVVTKAFERPLLVLGRENLNRGTQGDIVVVELLPKREWKHVSTKIVEETDVNRDENPDTDASQEIVTESERRTLAEEAQRVQRDTSEFRVQPTARVLGIVKRDWRYYVGHIDAKSLSTLSVGTRGQATVFVLPMDKRIPKIKIRSRQTTALVGNRIVVAIDKWSVDSRHPQGHFVRSLGPIEDQGAETEALLLEYDVQYRPFAKAVLDCLPKEGHDWRVPADTAAWGNRQDLRDLLICSIDPPKCQDIDDALHARELPNGNYEVGVHIADVTHFVKPDTSMDDEAAGRGTTVYLVDKRIDMLPMLLGTDLCSLKPYVERYAFSTIWEITKDGDVVNSKFTKSVIKSREAFSYEQAQLRIDDKSNQDDLTKGMRILLKLSKILKQKRMDAGALNLASPEVKVLTDSETSDPVDVEVKELHETNSLVEEFMLLANISVAEKIYHAFPQTAILRRHAAPPATNFETLKDQLKNLKGFTLDTSSSKALADSLDKCVVPDDPFFNTLVRIVATRCMLAAEYFVSGDFAYPEFRHYGLASPIYTHFTSPIRRYADVLAHRQLAAAIEYEPMSPSMREKNKLELICQNINRRHRNAQFAGRASVEYYVGKTLKGQVRDVDGSVMRIFSNGFVVLIPSFGIEGAIRIRDLPVNESDVEFDENNYALNFATKSHGKVPLRLFDKAKVRITTELEESTEKRKVHFSLISPDLS